jgi:sugar lactone lactonase YvrE
MRPKTAVLAVSLLVLLLGLPPAAAGSGHVRTLVEFDPAAGQLSEGVAVDKRGDVFVSLAPLGQLVKVERGTRAARPFGAVPGIDPASDFGLLGLAVGPQGHVYGAVRAAAAQGVWRFDRRTGAATRLPGTEAIAFPNGLAFGRRGDLYVTSSAEGRSPTGARQGAIWRVALGGGVERVLVHEALGGTGELIPPDGVGANGIVHRRGVLYVANLEKATILAVRLGAGGSLGTPEVIASGPDLANPDGLALDARGRLYVAVISQSAIVRLRRDGTVERVASAADGLDWPSSLAFGPARRGRRQPLYAVNFAVGPQFGAPPGAGPALLRVRTGLR